MKTDTTGKTLDLMEALKASLKGGTESARPSETPIDPLNELGVEQQNDVLRRRIIRARSALLNATHTKQTVIKNALKELGDVYE